MRAKIKEYSLTLCYKKKVMYSYLVDRKNFAAIILRKDNPDLIDIASDLEEMITLLGNKPEMMYSKSK